MLKFLPEDNDHVIAIKAIDCIEHEDHIALTAMLDKVTEGEKNFSLYFDVSEMTNWDVVEIFDEFMILLHNWGRFDRVAVVGVSEEEALAVKIMNLFVPGTLRFYGLSDEKKAQEWLDAVGE